MDSGSTNDRGAGTTFGSFRIVRRLAVGGSAEVFLAQDASGGRRVLKVPFDSGSRKDERNDAIVHEAAIGSRLVHPAIVRIEGVEREGDELALVEEYVDGVSLDALLESARLPPDVAIRILVSLAHALDVAHRTTDADGVELGLVHRDLHPHNVLVSRAGDVKLLDFGIARSRLSRSRTRTGALKGTLRYLAPEQATSSELDRRTDVYALGLVGFEMLAHEPYLVGSSDVELLRAAENPQARSLDADVDPDVRDAIGRALARFPEERFGTALAFAKRIERFAGAPDVVRRFLADAVAPLLPPESPTPTAARPVVASRRAAAIATVVIAGGVAAFVFVSPRLPARSTITPPEPVVAATLDVPVTSRPATEPAVIRPREPVAAATRPSTPRTTDRPTTPTTDVPTTDHASDAPVAIVDPGTAPSVTLPTRDAIRTKLARADAALRSARSRGDDVALAEGLSRDALSAYVEGRYSDADRLLDRILADVTSR